MATYGILVGGGPAPGINGVIGAAATVALQSGARVIGCLDGFKWLMEGERQAFFLRVLPAPCRETGGFDRPQAGQ